MSRSFPPAGAVFAVVALCFSACSDPVGLADPFIQPDLVEFDGRFSVTHSFSVPGTSISAGCTGDADLDSDRGIQFTGTIDIDASGPCADITNRVGQILGSIRGQAITFAVSGLPDPMAAIECTTIGGPPVFEGSYTIREVPGDLALVQTLRGTRELRAMCGDAEVDARWEIRASRR
ncbi:MAG TPA: hypothetical protein VG799_02665 [Gemmatimonadota bacterium]|jgi:hypothetical protein|nr:hypothetical protein [Gemmatimonadota bacterium]